MPRHFQRSTVAKLSHGAGLRLAPFLIVAAFICFWSHSSNAAEPTTNAVRTATELVEVSGSVEFAPAGTNSWVAAKTGQILRPGDRLRTRTDSRATIRLSDRSVVRMDQSSTLEIQAPRAAPAEHRFRLPGGSLFFLNREKPSNVEFETPLTTGAIRGTEFLLRTDPASGETLVALFDGAVDLASLTGSASLKGGEQAVVRTGEAPRTSAVLPAMNLIQWCLYYPAVLNVEDLGFNSQERLRLADVIETYRSGDPLGALKQIEDSKEDSSAARWLRASLKLAVGQVGSAEFILANTSSNDPPARALHELIAAVRRLPSTNPPPATGSEWLARSYLLQSQTKLSEALAAARKARELRPDFGFAWVREAELEWSFENRRAALAALDQGLRLSPKNAQALALKGFIALEANRTPEALEQFNAAIGLDAALGSAWLGRGLTHAKNRDFESARRDLQVASALEPQRSLFRSYLAKAFSELGDDASAAKDFRQAKALDPNDPTPWLYSGLHLQQRQRFNESVRDLSRSIELNDNRAVIRPGLLLDRDRAVRSADLAASFEAVGLEEPARLAASRAVESDYETFSGHLFLAESLRRRSDGNAYDLRLETPRESELLLANLLAPAGGGNLSRLLSQQDRLRFFHPRPIGFSSLTEYRSGGEWLQDATVFGTVMDLGYALDTRYESRDGTVENQNSERLQFSLQLKQQLTPSDSVYLQAGYADLDAGDIAAHYDPTANPGGVNPGLRVTEEQFPGLLVGLHHEWSPASHSLLLVSHLQDRLRLSEPQPSIPFLRYTAGNIAFVDTVPVLSLENRSDFSLTSAELQQIWQSEHHGLIAGARFQTGSVKGRLGIEGFFGPLTDDSIRPDLERWNAYARYQWSPIRSLRITAGLAFDHLRYPANADFAPPSANEETRSAWSPSVGLTWEPWSGGSFRAAYAQSLGGLYFDNSVRLEPAQLAGFTTAYRSLVPESVAGLVPGTRFETWGVGFDQSLRGPTFFGVSANLRRSDASRSVGALTNSTPLPIADSPSPIRQTLDFEERSLSLHVAHLIGDRWSVGARYELAEAELAGRFPGIPNGTPGLSALEQDNRAVLGRLQLFGIFNHESGLFAQWRSELLHQDNDGYSPDLPGDTFWQHHAFIGYRFPRHAAEVRLGILNLTDQHYRLNTLNLTGDLPRERTFAAQLRLNF